MWNNWLYREKETLPGIKESAKNLWMDFTVQYQIFDLPTWEQYRNIAQGEGW